MTRSDFTTAQGAWEEFAASLAVPLDPIQLAAVRGIFLAGVQSGVLLCRTTLHSVLELDFGALSQECLTLALDGEDGEDR